jgi:hypothetical protein
LNLKNELPNNPVELIRLSVANLIQAEQSDLYIINMYNWHIPLWYGNTGTPTQCWVCLAGSVMAFSLGAVIYDDVSPAHFGSNEGKLMALNSLRLGSVHSFLIRLNQNLLLEKLPTDITFYEIPRYSDDPELFKKRLLELADELEKYL